jgi:UDP-N-acetylglucosamine--N-acetylmuramyl-(pentapeptide) pyrophosphoryl-undecaprenol N-acetylglucosamine transferase
LAVGAVLAERGWRVSFAGSARGLEARLVPARGVEFFALPARPVLGRGPLAKLGAGWTLGRSALKARSLIRRLGVDVVAGTGGYASVPAVCGGRLARKPLVLIEPNAHAGAANRFLSRWARAAAVGYASAVDDLRCPALITGVPVRAEFFDVPAPALSPAAPRLLVLGGSQGARRVNEVVPAAIARLAPRLAGLKVLHQAGERHLEATREAYRAVGLEDGAGVVEIVAFLDDVAGALRDAQLVLSRAGAIATAEICAAGRASVLLPLRIAAGHQVENARLLEERGAALQANEEEGGEALAAAVAGLFAEADRLRRMGEAARALSRPAAAVDIADLIEHVAGRAAR